MLVTDTPTQPPVADRRPAEWTFHGDTRSDEYAWLADREDPATIAYLTAENAYTEAATAHLAGLRETLFTEIKTRTLETDLSLPVRHHGFWYYTRTEEGKQYGIQCRVPVTPGDGGDVPPLPTDGQPLPGEDVLLDGNELAAGARLLRARHVRREPRRQLARLLQRLLRRRALHRADPQPGHRRTPR